MARQKESPVTNLDQYLRIINLRTHLALELLQKCGSEDQIARYARGALPVDELLTMARAELFAPFGGMDLKRFAKSREMVSLHRRIAHSKDCPEIGRDDSEIHEIDLPALVQTPAEQKHLDMLVAHATTAARHEFLQTKFLLDPSAGDALLIETRTYRATCAACRAHASCTAAKVSIRWAEHTLVREWLL